MSAIAGVYRRDGAPASVDTLRPMTAAMAHRAHKPWQYWNAGPIALAAAGAGAGPAHDPSRRLSIVLDGRIDNGDDLSRTLGQAGLAGPDLVLSLYARWGIDAIVRILGDFAFAIRDEAADRLVCARDYLGQRPLFYASGRRFLAFGSELPGVLQHPDVGRGINEAMVAEHLTSLPATTDETLWRDVCRLPPAHVLIADAGTVRLQRYWDFVTDRPGDERPGERTSRFRDLFTEAVECRTRGARRVGVLLSGGVDSSAVAGALQATGRKNGHTAHALSFMFPGRSCDERRFIDAVVNHTGLHAVRVESPAVTRELVRAEILRHVDTPSAPTGAALVEPLKRRARALGIETVLTGCGGDEWFTGFPPTAAELLAAGRARDAGRALLAQARSQRGASATARGIMSALLPDVVRRRLLRHRASSRVFPWIRESLAARVGLRERIAAQAPPPLPSPARRAMHAFSRSATQVLALEAEDRASQACGITESHPFYDRRVAEFAFALPNEACWQDGRTKVIVREALAHCLPGEVLERSDKAEFSEVFVEALESLGGARLFASLRSEEAGWVDGAQVRARYASLVRLYRARDEAYSSLVDGIWEVAGLEMWLEHTAGLDAGSEARDAICRDAIR